MTTLDELDSFLDEPLSEGNMLRIPTGGDIALEEIVELPKGTIDPRLTRLSHSSRLTLHSCPRKYQLYRLNATTSELGTEVQRSQDVTFAYGKAVGTGIQSTLESKSKVDIIMDTFLSWDTDLTAANEKQKKSWDTALFAVLKFISMREAGYLAEYELVRYNGKPAVELGFSINLPNGFTYRGYVDVVLQHTATKEVIILELKTTSAKTNSATYKNSGQALGYGVVLDKIFPDLSSYNVLYLVYESKSYEFKELIFGKSLLQRALWLQELLIDTELISTYEQYAVYPQHGESCYNFYRECEYLGLCTMSTSQLTKPLTSSYIEKLAEEQDNYDFIVDFYELVEQQIVKGEL